MAGRCVIPVQEHISRLITIRMSADIMNSNLIIVARTDSEAATLLSSTIDKRDHYFIVGATNPNQRESFVEVIDEAIGKGYNATQLAAVEQKWIEEAGLKLFHEAFADEVKKSELPAATKQEIINKFNAKVGPLTETSNKEARAIAKQLLGHDIYFNWETPRVREGLYRYRGGTQCAVMRARAFADYADLVWMESNYPDYEQAKEFAEGVKAKYPNQWLAYNLSPSFNWTNVMSPQDQKTFIQRLGDLGYIWQFITLSLIHI